MAKYKNGVVWSGEVYYNMKWHKVSVCIQIQRAIAIAERIYKDKLGIDLVVTCLIEGFHSKNSLHPQGKAFDIRTWDKNGTQFSSELKTEIKEALEYALGSDFDIVVEGDHIHIEYDPK